MKFCKITAHFLFFILLFISCTSSSYANPHAPTAIGGIPLNPDVSVGVGYDKAGNLTSEGMSLYAFDYNNRLVNLRSLSSGTLQTTNYTHDEAGNRLTAKDSGAQGITTYFPTREYNEDSNGQTIKHLFGNGVMVATIVNTPTLRPTPTVTSGLGQVVATTTALYFDHTDHLGGLAVSTNASGTVAEVTDYYAYGAPRIDDRATSYSEQRKYIGEIQDVSGLNYLNARYYNSSRGQFISEDPVFWELGLSQDGKSALLNPQSQNSYGYGNGNPVGNRDPGGRFVDIILDAAFIGNDLHELNSAWHEDRSLALPIFALALDSAGAALPGVTGLGVAGRGLVKVAEEGRVAEKISVGLARQTELVQKIGEGANERVVNLIKSVFKESDGISGGTVGAIKSEMMSGQPTKGVFHAYGKAETVSNTAKNILSDFRTGRINLKSIEVGVVRGIQNGIERARGVFIKSLAK